MENVDKLPENALEEVAGGKEAVKLMRYCVVRGDTLAKLAHRYGTTVQLIIAYNNLDPTKEPFAGTTLVIPVGVA